MQTFPRIDTVSQAENVTSRLLTDVGRRQRTVVLEKTSEGERAIFWAT